MRMVHSYLSVSMGLVSELSFTNVEYLLKRILIARQSRAYGFFTLS